MEFLAGCGSWPGWEEQRALVDATLRIVFPGLFPLTVCCVLSPRTSRPCLGWNGHGKSMRPKLDRDWSNLGWGKVSLSSGFKGTTGEEDVNWNNPDCGKICFNPQVALVGGFTRVQRITKREKLWDFSSRNYLLPHGDTH